MWEVRLTLLISAFVLSSQAQQDFTNSVYYATSNVPTLSSNSVSAEQSSRDVLKELGVDLSSEGRPQCSLITARRQLEI